MKVKLTNEMEIVHRLINERGISRTNLARRMDISPQNLYRKLKEFDDSQLRMSCTTFYKLLQGLGYEIAIVPEWRARQIKNDKDVIWLESRDVEVEDED